MENNEKNESIKQETVSRMNPHTILTKEITTVSLIFFLPINTKKKMYFSSTSLNVGIWKDKKNENNSHWTKRNWKIHKRRSIWW